MNSRWKTFSAEIKRIFTIVFEQRDIEIIREDHFSGKWISKAELIQLIEHEENQFIITYSALQKDYHDLLQSFNLNSLSNYQLLERKMQGKLK